MPSHMTPVVESPNPVQSVRKRAPNFTHEERRILVELIRPHFGIVESKNAERETYGHKKRAWNAITVRYNQVQSASADGGVLRSQMQLKLCYESLKYRMRRSSVGMMRTATAAATSAASATSSSSVDSVGNQSAEAAAVRVEPKVAVEMECDTDSKVKMEPSSEDESVICATPLDLKTVKTSPMETQTDTAFSVCETASQTNPFCPDDSKFIAPYLSAELSQLLMRHEIENQTMKRQRHSLKMKLLRAKVTGGLQPTKLLSWCAIL